MRPKGQHGFTIAERLRAPEHPREDRQDLRLLKSKGCLRDPGGELEERPGGVPHDVRTPPRAKEATQPARTAFSAERHWRLPQGK